MIRKCSSCGKKNRIPARHLAAEARCGACKKPLASLDVPVVVDSAEFGEILRDAAVPIFVDFWAPWCAPCRMAAPEVDRLAARVAGKAMVLKINTEEHPDVAQRYGIQAIPTFMVFKDGAEVFRHSGLSDHREMERWLDRVGVGHRKVGAA
jgi:thioredoxin 2